MATSGSVVASGDMIVDNFNSSCGNVSSFARPVGHFVERNLSFYVASLCMKSREPNKSIGVNGYFIFGVTHKGSNVSTFGEQLGRRYNTSSSMHYLEGGISDGVLKEPSHDENIGIPAIDVDGYLDGVAYQMQGLLFLVMFSLFPKISSSGSN